MPVFWEDRYFYGKPVEVWSLQDTDDHTQHHLFAGRGVVNASSVHLTSTIEKVTVIMPLCTVVEI